MSHGDHWHSGQYSQINSQITQDPQYQTVATNNAQSGHRLLAVYPPASATPTHHVSRHVSNISLTAAPTFPQPSYHNHQNSGYYPPPYSEYDRQLHYLATAQAPVNDTGYWENARNDAVKMLNEQAGHSYQYREPTQWLNPMPQSNYETNAFAQSVFQRTDMGAAYPTPPPPGISPSSSSLAHALGTPPSHGHSRPVSLPQKMYQSQESRAFYEDFLDRKLKQMNQQAPPSLSPPKSRNSASYSFESTSNSVSYIPNPLPNAVNSPPSTYHHFNATQNSTPTYSLGGALVPHSVALPSPQTHVNSRNPSPYQTPVLHPPVYTALAPTPQPAIQEVPPHPFTPVSKTQTVDDSPDPLSLQSGGSMRTASSTTLTPRKRKLVVEIQTPVKRLHSTKSLSSSSIGEKSKAMTTPQSTQSSVPITPGSSKTSLSSRHGSSVDSTPKRINLAYVELPSPPYLTPMSSRKLDSDDLGGYCTENDSPIKKMCINDSVKSSARRTGDRDERGPLEKLSSLIEDIFEAEDSLSPEVDSSDLNHEFFSPISLDCSRPQLAPAIIRKLIKYIGHVARPTKRIRQATGGVIGTPRGKGRMTDMDVQHLSRLLKILDRSVRAGEDVDPFPHAHVSTLPSSAKTSPKKPNLKKSSKAKKGERRSRSATPKQGEHGGEDEFHDEGSLTVPTDRDFEKVSTQLDTARDSILAADCCIALLASDRLPKQLYSEELIMACLNSVKNQLTKILYPFVESFSETGSTTTMNPILQSVVKNKHSSSSVHGHQLSELYQALSAVIPRINDLVGAESVAMSDTIIISAVYIAIGPFFVVDADTDPKSKKDNAVIKTLGKSAMRGLRLDALSLIRSIFANHESQRSWIIEEILTSLIKLSDTKQKAGQFRLRDGRSIRTVSALLLQLVQTSAHDVRIQARKIEQARKNNIALKRQESFSDCQSQQMQCEPFLDDTDRDELHLYGTALESATKAAKTIILFLTQRSGKGKVTKNSNEAEYRAIFDNLIDDLLVVLFWPEWPAASLILSIASKFMVSSLDDIKNNSQTENNAAKQTALDHLGVIAAKIRTIILKFPIDNTAKGRLYPLEDIVSNINLRRLDRFLEAHHDVASHLCKRSSEDQAYDSAREMTAAALGQELSSALKGVQGWIEQPDMGDDSDTRDHNKLLVFGQRLKQALRDVWKDPSTDVFNIGSQEEAFRIDALSEEIGTIQNLRNSFNPILSVILMALDSPAIFVRTKALKALGVIVTSDSTILSAPNVRRGIESHLLDSSAAVRDAAVELIGKYIIDSPKVAIDYYQKIADRIADTAVSVRRRVIKLLKAFYNVTEDNNCMIDIATRLVLRILDEDETIKELATKSIEELWFPSLALPSALKNRVHTNATNSHDKTTLLTKVSVVMGTAANFKDRQSPLEDVLHKIMVGKESSERASLHVRYGEICEALIDGLVDASDLPGFTVTNCVRTIYLLTSAYPSILSGSNASTLLPYLKNASSAEEMTTSDYLLKIFRVAVPHMPKTAAKFGQELQAALQPMIIKPSGGGGVQIMQETVGCMCVVVQHLTHDFVRLINLMKSCNARLQQLLKRPTSQALAQNDVRALVMLIFIVSLLAEKCNFDNLRQEQQNLVADVDSISQGSITEHVYLTLLTLYEKYDNGNLRARVLQCLGFLFRAQPTLMTMERSAYIMDQIFASPEEEEKGRLLKIIHDFLVSESEKHTALAKESSTTKTQDVNMDELVGNTEGFADSGVTSAIVQRYLDHVLEAALSQKASIQTVAIDVLTFTVKQGLAHPLQSFPVIVALETSPIISINNRASALHAILQGKHASLLNARYTVSARKAFEYQKKIVAGSVQGFRMQPTPVALLHRWYCHVREKRAARQDFLKSLVKVFQENGTLESSQDDVSYSRYMAENFATFEYKTLEEVLTVIRYLTNILSTTGMQLLEIVSPSHLLTHLHSKQNVPLDTMVATVQINDNAKDQDPQALAEKLVGKEIHQCDMPAIMRTSVIIAIVMLLKAHLKTLYSLSEDKCSKFVVGKKSTIGDKSATKRNENPISWHRLPFATTALLTTEDAEAQKATFLEIWNEDGFAADPQDEEFL